MDRMIYLSMSGAKATMQRQDVLANNLANASLNASAAQGQMQLSVELSSVNQKIGAPNGGVAFVNDAPFYIAYMQGLAAAKNYALNSHIRPHDLTASEIMNAHMAGVEP